MEGSGEEEDDDDDDDNGQGGSMVPKFEEAASSTVDTDTGLIKSDEVDSTPVDTLPSVKRQTFLFSATLLHAPKISDRDEVKVGGRVWEAARAKLPLPPHPALTTCNASQRRAIPKSQRAS